MSLDPHGPQDLKGTTEAVVHRHDGCLASGVAMCFPSPVNSYLTYIEWGKTSHPSDTLYSIGKMKKNLNSRPGKAQAFAIYIYIFGGDVEMGSNHGSTLEKWRFTVT